MMEALLSYPDSFRQAKVEPLGNGGGFSGARLWKVQTQGVDFALKAFPTGSISAERLRWIHRLMGQARTRGLTFVPAIVPLREGGTVIEQGDWLWEMASWMPGAPDVSQAEQACVALARLHQVWADFAGPPAIGPAIVRRWDALHVWQSRLRAGWQIPITENDHFGFFHSIMPKLSERIEATLHQLRPWTEIVCPIQPCVCDPWSAHFLFQNQELTGLIDYTALKQDHTAVDLARLLGSFLPMASWDRALQAYQSIRPLSELEIALIYLLEPSGALVAILNWMDRIFCRRDLLPDPDAVEERVRGLIERAFTAESILVRT